MEIDGFTFVAQIINFIILLVLLRLTLYKPIIKVMREREEAIKARLHDADEKFAHVEKQSKQLSAERHELESEREHLMVEARKAARERRHELEEEARAEVEAARSRWLAELSEERDDFFQRLRLRIAKEVVSISREALTSLANAELEHQIANAFLEQLEAMPDDERHALVSQDHAPESPLVVYSMFELDASIRERLAKLLGPDAAVDYARAPELICGIELKTSGYDLAWSIESYLDTLEPRLLNAFGEMVTDDAAAD